ncbi:protein ANTAGONIST OF LIKE HETEROCHROMATIN PROTEIN 1 [Ixodes scapularis]
MWLPCIPSIPRSEYFYDSVSQDCLPKAKLPVGCLSWNEVPGAKDCWANCRIPHLNGEQCWHGSQFQTLPPICSRVLKAGFFEVLLKRQKQILLTLPSPRRWWVRTIWQNRRRESEFHTAMPLLISGDTEYFQKYYKMRPENFEELHSLVETPLTRAYLTREPLLSRARLAMTLRRCAENAFGVLASRFRIFRRTINLLPEHADYVVMATCALHNYLRDDSVYIPPSHVDKEDAHGNITNGNWQSTFKDDETVMTDLEPPVGHNYSGSAREARDLFCSYFMSRQGAVPWQRTSAGLHP